MRKLLIISVFVIICNSIYSQKDSIPVLYNPEFYPSYPGGEQELFEFLDSNLVYPESEKLYGIYGKVYVQFFVEKDGSLSNFEVKRSPHELLSKEALRVCKLMPKKWEPGGYYSPNGKVYTKCRMVLPIKFQNQNDILDATFYYPILPSFPGGDSARIDFINKNLNKPKDIKSQPIKGKVYCQFTVEKDGSLSNFKIIRSPNDILSQEVLRVMKLMPNWNPAIEKHIPISWQLVQPFNFK